MPFASRGKSGRSRRSGTRRRPIASIASKQRFRVAKATNGQQLAQDVEKAEANLKRPRPESKSSQRPASSRPGAVKEEVLAAEAEVVMAKANSTRPSASWTTGAILLDQRHGRPEGDIGSLASRMSFNVAASLCEIADLSKLEVEVDVPERAIAEVREEPRLHDPSPMRTTKLYVMATSTG